MKKIIVLTFLFLLGSVVIHNHFSANAAGLKMPGLVLGTTNSVYAYESGSLVNDKGTIYFINGAIKIPFTSMEAFLGLGYSLSNVIQGDLSNYNSAKKYFISSPIQAHPWGSYLLHKGTVYYSHELGLIPIPSWSVFVNNGGKQSLIVKANENDLKALKDVAELPVLSVNDSRIYAQKISGAIQSDLLPVETNVNNPTNVAQKIKIQCEYPAPPLGFRYEGQDSENNCGKYLVLDIVSDIEINPTPTPVVNITVTPTPQPTTTPAPSCQFIISCPAPPIGYYYEGASNCSCGVLTQDSGNRKTGN